MGHADMRRARTAPPALTRRSSGAPTGHQTEVPSSVHHTLQTPGEPLSRSARAFFEPRFGHDFGNVRVHHDAMAAQSARDVKAHAYAVGQHIAFDHGQYAPESHAGRELIAHELAHVVQQAPTLQRTPDDAAADDPLCATFDLDATRKEVEAQAKHFVDTDDLLPLVRSLKRFRRCATPEQQTQILDDLSQAIPSDKATEAWNSAGTAFGGYVGFYPGYAPDIKSHLGKLGTSESLSASTFELSREGRKHRSRAKASAAKELGDLGRTDIVYFRGHQYAQYRAPGLFANGDESRGFDLRYVEKVGGFSNVKLMISTSCATLCKEAIEVFSGLFPNAVILGYRKSAPIEGAAVRSDLTQRINALNRPLLIDEPVDVATIISIWKSVIESRHKGHTSPLPGYYQGSTVEYWDGSTWQSIPATDPANACRRKGDFSGQYPAPP
ncbi:hypothetical protein CR158_06965 [Halomonas heilongjiangensis]|uniref:eCIS core domain-containing protein n=2 Tax=Halomonas heilongjiangensis TaxID=1387883 RepID=A0A2N7TFH1_9GAMM|nr:hypothetical protein C1H66_22240 [Halomonas heilongjiangensis]PXX91463.1 hypothetical protein CR158_06965 [Halomonas heilongjiangensis]